MAHIYYIYVIYNIILVLKFGLTVSVPELDRRIPSLLIMFLLKVAGNSWVLGTENLKKIAIQVIVGFAKKFSG